MSDDMTAGGTPNGDDTVNAALLAEIRGLAALIDPVPPEAIAAARSAFAWRTMDAELAELTADSAVDERLAGVRGAGTPTMLTFDAPGLTVEVELQEVGGHRRLMGQLVPPGPGLVEVRHRAGAATVPVDEVGRFSADDVAAGPVSLRCSSGTQIVETDWFLA